MQKQRKSHNDIIYILNALFKKRVELIAPFLERINEWIALSFKYELNPSAFSIVRDLYVTLWIDTHFESLLNADLPESIRQKALSSISEIIEIINNPSKSIELNSNINSNSYESASIKHKLLLTKITIINDILNLEDHNTKKLDELRHSYQKDKRLLEREFKRFSKEIS